MCVNMTLQEQREASSALSSLGVAHALAPPTNSGLIRPDLVAVTAAGRVAICLDPPESFATNDPTRPLGAAILNWRLLALHNMQVRRSLLCCPLL